MQAPACAGAAKVGLPAAIPELDAVEVEVESVTVPYSDDASHYSLSTVGEYSTAELQTHLKMTSPGAFASIGSPEGWRWAAGRAVSHFCALPRRRGGDCAIEVRGA